MSGGGNGSDLHGTFEHHSTHALAAEAVGPEIARRTGLSRNTITKHLAEGTIEPKFATPDRPRLDPFSEKLTGWLKTEAGKSRKQRRTLKQMHAHLVKLGFTGSYIRAVR